MTSLADFQAAFQQSLLRADAPSLRALDDCGGDTAQHRAEVYVGGYTARLLEVLEQDFEATRRACGELSFARLARTYIAGTPSRHRSLRVYGAGFPAHLAGLPVSLIDRSDAELARFEWALGETFDAPDDAVLSPATLAAMPVDRWPQWSPRLHPAVRILHLHWNTPQRHAALLQDETAPDLAEEPASWLLWRRGTRSKHRRLAPDEALALACFQRGGTWHDACHALALERDADGTRVARLAGYVQRWTVDGLLSSCMAGAADAGGDCRE